MLRLARIVDFTQYKILLDHSVVSALNNPMMFGLCFRLHLLKALTLNLSIDLMLVIVCFLTLQDKTCHQLQRFVISV